jgi:ribosomal protein S13
VPAPWSCTYDVASKQVEPVNPPAGDQPEEETAAPAQQSSDQGAANNPSADNSTESQTDEANDNDFPGEKFPATRLDELTVPDVNESSLDEINYAINEMYARHGADFKDKKVSNQFSEFSWYKPHPGMTRSAAESEFSDLETANLKTLQRCRDAKVAAAHRKSRPVRGQRTEEESTGEKVIRGIRTWQDMGAPMPPHP